MKFADDRKVAESPALRFADDNPEGKIFLRLTGARMIVKPEDPLRPEGQKIRYAVGGTKIGLEG